MHIILMIVGAVVVYLLLKRIYQKNWNRHLSCDISFSASNAVCGDTVELVEVVTNYKKLPLPIIHLKFQADNALIFKDGSENTKTTDSTYRDDVFSLFMDQRITRRIPVTCTQRGVYGVRNIELIFNGLFMDDVSVYKVKSISSLTVYPDPYLYEDMDILYSRVLGLVERNSLINSDPFAFRQIREYEINDPMNTINWKASARSGSLMVNQFNETTCQEVCILLNLEPEGMLVYNRLSEASISIAAGIAETLLDSGISVGILSNGRDYDTGENIFIYPEGDAAHIKNIDTGLARINLPAGQDEFVSMINSYTDDFTRQIFDNENNTEMLYILISQNSRSEIVDTFNSIIGKDADNIFIVPHFRDKEINLDSCNGTVIPWEVTHNAKG